MPCDHLLLVGLLLGQALPAQETLPILHKAPDFSLVDQAGREVRLADLKGRVVLVNFFFTTCSATCPGATLKLVAVQREGKKQGLSGKEWQLLSITLDPGTDSPAVLAKYARLFDIDAAAWKFLTGPVDRVNKVIADWGVWVKPAAKDQPDHPSWLFLVDRHGRLRARYDLDSLRLPKVMADVGALLKEK